MTRFLGWRLPDDFHPDGGVVFERVMPNGAARPREWWPVGTNLLTAVQVRAMLEYVLGHYPADATAAAFDRARPSDQPGGGQS